MLKASTTPTGNREPRSLSVSAAPSDERHDIADGRPRVVATHGMTMTVWLTARIGLPHPGACWADLRFLYAHRVDPKARTITRIL